MQFQLVYLLVMVGVPSLQWWVTGTYANNKRRAPGDLRTGGAWVSSKQSRDEFRVLQGQEATARL